MPIEVARVEIKAWGLQCSNRVQKSKEEVQAAAYTATKVSKQISRRQPGDWSSRQRGLRKIPWA
jgi:hypothetical protein